VIYARINSRFAVLMRINNIKLELKIKRTKQVILANRQEAASVSVHERALQLQSTGEMYAEARAVAGF